VVRAARVGEGGERDPETERVAVGRKLGQTRQLDAAGDAVAVKVGERPGLGRADALEARDEQRAQRRRATRGNEAHEATQMGDIHRAGRKGLDECEQGGDERRVGGGVVGANGVEQKVQPVKLHRFESRRQIARVAQQRREPLHRQHGHALVPALQCARHHVHQHGQHGGLGDQRLAHRRRRRARRRRARAKGVRRVEQQVEQQVQQSLLDVLAAAVGTQEQLCH
jgi:hypothetical protein